VRQDLLGENAEVLADLLRVPRRPSKPRFDDADGLDPDLCCRIVSHQEHAEGPLPLQVHVRVGLHEAFNLAQGAEPDRLADVSCPGRHNLVQELGAQHVQAARVGVRLLPLLLELDDLSASGQCGVQLSLHRCLYPTQVCRVSAQSLCECQRGHNRDMPQ